MKKKDLQALPEPMNTVETLLHGVGQRLDVLIDLMERNNVPRETVKVVAEVAEVKQADVPRETKEEKKEDTKEYKPKAKAKSARKKQAKE